MDYRIDNLVHFELDMGSTIVSLNRDPTKTEKCRHNDLYCADLPVPGIFRYDCGECHMSANVFLSNLSLTDLTDLKMDDIEKYKNNHLYRLQALLTENTSNKKKRFKATQTVSSQTGATVPGDTATEQTTYYPEQMLRYSKLVPSASAPTHKSKGAAGYDLASAYEITVPAYGKAQCKTGLCIAVPKGTYGRIAGRSGITWQHHIDIAAGVIDSDYRGEVAVVLFNHSSTDFHIFPGDRIAQLILEKHEIVPIVETEQLDQTERGQCGFGSTGV